MKRTHKQALAAVCDLPPISWVRLIARFILLYGTSPQLVTTYRSEPRRANHRAAC